MEEKTETVFEAEENPFVSKFEQFFSQQYKKNIEKLAAVYPEKKSLEIDFKELEEFDFELADSLLDNPDYLIEAAEIAVKSIDIPVLDSENFNPFIRVFNLPKDSQPLLRDIGSQHLGKLISVEGVIRQITDVLPRLKVAKWECRSCGNTYKIHQSGTVPTSPAICECKHREFRLLPNSSDFIDSQKIEIQEPLEFLRGSEQAVNLELNATNDLVNKASAGDRTRITGILRLRAPKDKKLVFMRYLEVIHLEETAREFEEVEISKEEETKIKELAENPKIYEMLTQSIAPAIYGHEKVKEAIVLQLFGGVKKTLPGKAIVRGNIHVLLVGDPGVAKSQILMAVNNIAPKSIYIAGKTSTGVGITASAVKDDFGEGGWTLKAGALVLASGGLANIDEFDKMERDDRSAMHEAMEQQMVSVAKAGIVTRFKTETSILAAANPKFSRFDPYEPFIKQIDLPSTLISRFDLFFMIRDVLDRVKDEEITASILKTHKAGEMILQGKRTGRKDSKEMQELKALITPLIETWLMKKYISFARQKISPVLSDDAIKALSEFYLNLREMGKKEGSYAATHRQLEGLIRLSEASARVRLSDSVDKADAERAIRLLKNSLQDVVTDPETGRIDMDIINIGTTHSKMTAMRNVLNIIRQKAKEQDLVPIIEVIEEAKILGLEKDKVNEIISDLKRKGEIYEKKHGFISPVEQ
ncbi:MAG: minichromosome maintenance protein MCM [archaeon]